MKTLRPALLTLVGLAILHTPGWALDAGEMTPPRAAEVPASLAPAPVDAFSGPVIVELQPECEPSGMALEGRASPYDSASVQVGEAVVKVCYGRPSARGRTMIGGDDVPFGALWRTGANEPTVIHTTTMIALGGIHLDPGSYAIYTIPGEDEWEVFVSRSVDHWGLQIDEDVRAQEVGSLTVPRERPDDHVETFTISFTPPAAGATEMVLEWERFRISLPVEVHGG